jgi:hypothetical protein
MSAAPRRRGGGRRAAGAARPTVQHTSMPTSREAYAETRRWLLARHGPVCAYCRSRVDVGTITLDHCTPRRGQSAYDRRDNLVLCCRACNAAKKDKSFMAFLLERRDRAISLLRYGTHLSHGLMELVHQLAGPDEVARAQRLADPDYPYAD